MKPNKEDYTITYDEVWDIINERIEAIDSVDYGGGSDVDEDLMLEFEARQAELYRLSHILRRLRDAKAREYKRQVKLSERDNED
tara:strand:- start:4630 stop:4881 length:252 start_codon:yes stop_codon:yes gene_type:complete